MYKYLLFLMIVLLSGCRVTYYETAITAEPINEINREKLTNDIRNIYQSICINNNLELEFKASQKHPVDLYANHNLWISYNTSNLEISVRSYEKQKTSKMAKLFYETLKKNKSINIKRQELIYYGSRFF